MSGVRAALVMVLVTGAAPISAAAQSPTLKAVMQEKAKNAQGLLKPLVQGDFAGIERWAIRLGRLTLAEVASWQAQPNTEYHQQATNFVRAIEALGQAVEERNVTRASTAYANLVSSCVNCHQLVKASRSVLAPQPSRRDPDTSGDRRR